MKGHGAHVVHTLPRLRNTFSKVNARNLTVVKAALLQTDMRVEDVRIKTDKDWG